MGPYGHNPSIDEITAQYQRALTLISLIEKTRPGVNIMVSPLSIEIALLMIANTLGDRGKAAVLRYLGLSEDNFNGYAHRQLERLRNQETLSIANALWVRDHADRKLELIDDTQSKLIENFKIEHKKFKNSVKPINDWVKKVTRNKIECVITDDELTPDLDSVIANAVRFKSDWVYQLHNIGKRSFDSLDGKKQDIDFIGTTSTEIGYAENEDYQMIQMRYRDMSYFVAFLPKQEHTDKQSFSLPDNIRFSHDYKVKLEMPEFESEFGISLLTLAEELKLLEIFEPDEVSNLFKDNKYTLGDVKHKTYIKVDKQGTEAAAVTMGMVRGTSCSIHEPKRIKIVLDRPFYYGITSRYGDMLFIGKYKN